MNETEHFEEPRAAARLERERPVPEGEYRQRVGRWIELREQLMPTQGTQRLMAVGFAALGLLLALLAVLGLAGVGPLG